MRRTVCTLVVLASAAWPAAAAAQQLGHGSGPDDPPLDTHLVTTPGRYFTPAHTIALTGDTVTWRNADFTPHSVSALGGAVYSGPLSRGDSFSHRFEQTGTYPFLCTIHPFMTGEVTVEAALLSPPVDIVLLGRPAELRGRIPAGGGGVTIEQRAAGAAAFSPVETLAPAADGSFRTVVRPAASTTYRAVASTGASPPVDVRVAAQLAVEVKLVRGRRFTQLRVSARGGSGLVASLQLYLRERFSWRETQYASLDRSGRAGFRVRAGRRRARVVIAQSGGGPVLGTSRTVRLPRR